MLLVSVCCAALTAFLSSCAAGIPVQHEPQPTVGLPAVTYSIVCVIHGDSDYLYHDTGGNEHRADEEALAGAIRVAQQNPQAEVFIFHQQPRRHAFFLFPLRDGEFTYYRNGRLIARESYWRDQDRSRLDPEIELYRRFHLQGQRGMVRTFLYYGHEIPEQGGAGYDASYPDRTFTVHDLAAGLQGFMSDSSRFDLVILSTCFGGTPYTVGALGSVARYIVASPDNLHLSYFDLQGLERLDLGIRDGDVSAFAKQFAREAFDRLTKYIQTAVSIAVYDADRVRKFVQSVHGRYDHMLTTVEREVHASMATIEHCDCADLPAYVLPTMGDGVEVLYRPARFGRSKHKLNHSGWECWRERIPQDSVSQK